MKRRVLALAIATIASTSACSQGSDTGASGAAVPPAVAKGQQVYAVNCTACHASDPNENGALGPAVAGSSQELLEAKVLRGEYPPGYTPKRDSRAMIPLPHLANQIPDLAAYLASVKRGS